MLGAVIVTHSRPDLALSCLGSLGDAVQRGHVVVVVNDPRTSDAAALAVLAETVPVLSNPVPVGYAANINRGAVALPDGVDRMLLLNDDLRFDAGAVDLLCGALESRSDVAVAAPGLAGENGIAQAVCFRFPTVRTELAQVVMAPAPVVERLRGRDASAAPPGTRRVDWVLGAAMLVRREAFDAVDGFDEDFLMYSEETDFCRRLADLGWACVACGDARAVHLGGASTSNARWSRVLAESRHRYLARHWTPRRRLVLAVAFLVASTWNIAYVIAASVVRPSRRLTYLDAIRVRFANRVTLRALAPGS